VEPHSEGADTSSKWYHVAMNTCLLSPTEVLVTHPSLSEESAFFEEKRAEWLQHYAGQFAVVKDRQLVGTFTTFQEAYGAAIRQFGNVPVLIRQVLEHDPPQHVPALMHGLIRTNA